MIIKDGLDRYVVFQELADEGKLDIGLKPLLDNAIQALQNVQIKEREVFDGGHLMTVKLKNAKGSICYAPDPEYTIAADYLARDLAFSFAQLVYFAIWRHKRNLDIAEQSVHSDSTQTASADGEQK